MTQFIILVLATWRVTSIINREDGPFELVAKFRDLIHIQYDLYSNPFSCNIIGKMVCCFWCLSVWIGLLFAAVAYPPSEVFVNCWGISAGAIGLDVALDYLQNANRGSNPPHTG